MARRVFYSFDFKRDSWRTAQVRNIGTIGGARSITDNDWEEIKKGGDMSIKRWIDNQLRGRSCTVVLVGTRTAGREWVDYEIEGSWLRGMGVVGIHIHGLQDQHGKTSAKGKNPFAHFKLRTGEKLSSIVECYDPPGRNSQECYAWIEENLEDKVEEAIEIREEN